MLGRGIINEIYSIDFYKEYYNSMNDARKKLDEKVEKDIVNKKGQNADK